MKCLRKSVIRTYCQLFINKIIQCHFYLLLCQQKKNNNKSINVTLFVTCFNKCLIFCVNMVLFSKTKHTWTDREIL